MSGNPMPPGSGGGFDSGFITGEFRHQQVSARVPDDVARGVFSTGVIVLSNPTEFVLDFLVRMARPHQVVARVVMATGVVPSVIAVLRDNIQKYINQYGPIPPLPKPSTDRRPTIQEIYDDLKLPDERLSGVYANGVMIGHTPAEFCLDFITSFFPRSSVSCRVYLAAPHAPRLLDSLAQTFNDHQKRLLSARQNLPLGQQQPQPPSPGSVPPSPPGTPDAPGKGSGDATDSSSSAEHPPTDG